MTLETTLELATAEGFTLNAAYGFADATWHAEFAYRGKRCGFGQGFSLPEAINQALMVAREHKRQLEEGLCTPR
jgi:hypothetical protein